MEESYADIDRLRAKYNVLVTDCIDISLPKSMWGVDEIHAYLGTPSKHRLPNFDAFLAHNQLEPLRGSKVSWNHTVIIAVGYNRLTGLQMSLVHSMFPWPFPHHHHLDYPGIFDTPILDDYVPTHTLVCACRKCVERHTPCDRLPLLSCSHCEGPCEFSSEENASRAARCHQELVANAETLSPPYQHLIQCSKARNRYSGNPKMSSVVRSQLAALVRREYLGGDEEVSARIKAVSDSFQEVRFASGTLVISEMHHMEGVCGFVCNPKGYRDVAPHFGIASNRIAYSLVNSALEWPGRAFSWEGSIMYRNGFKTARILMNATIVAEDDMRITVGWKFKN